MKKVNNLNKTVDLNKNKILNELYNKLNNYEIIWNDNNMLRNNKHFSLDKIETVLNLTFKG